MNRMNFNKMAVDCISTLNDASYRKNDMFTSTETSEQIVERALKLTYSKGFKKALKEVAELVQLQLKKYALSELAPHILSPLAEMKPFPAERITKYSRKQIDAKDGTR